MQRYSILWADDEIDLLKPHIIFLEQRGYDITPVNNGTEAVEKSDERHYDVVFLDENMPGMSGLEALTQIKNNKPNLPVVMITKNEEEHIMEEAIGSKIADYLIKPLNPSQILLSVKKILDNKRLVIEKTNLNYQQEFRKISMAFQDVMNHEQWADIYKKLVFWELQMDQADNQEMSDILDMQKTEANAAFAKFIIRNYDSWLNDPKSDKPLLSHQIMKRKVFPELGKKPVFVILIDNLRYDQWKVIEPELADYFTVEKEETYYSILPTTTAYARNAIFSGQLPSEMAKTNPALWVGEDEDEGKNNFEDEFLAKQLRRNNLNIKMSYHKIKNLEEGRNLVDTVNNLFQNDLNVIVYNFVDMLSHARTDMAMVRELAPDESAYRSITKSWFLHSPLIDVLRKIADKDVRVVITTDHGTIRVKRPFKIIGDRSVNSNLRYKQGKNLGYEGEKVMTVQKPERLFLPKLNVSSYWMEKGFFHSEPDPKKEPYCIVIPPPNVTGVLHMGHMLNNTIQDILIRKARMEGKEACWVAGTDHASIATEAKVVAMLRERGIKKSDLSREEFLKYAWEWKEKYGGIILEQLKKLGASCDWDRTKFTMDPDYYDAVIDVFIDLYKKGNIYRGMRMVNWDPLGKTALSDDEVVHKDVQSKLYYIKYAVEGSSDFITIATVRPETIMADSAICVNPADERYKHLKGKKVFIPLINRAIPVIEDEYVTMDFGTGCLKVTPAHDMNDYELGKKHNLEVIDILDEDGTLNANAQILVGEDRFIARKKIAKLLEEKNQLAKVEDYTSSVGFSERTDAVIEPRLSLQWFLKMKEITKPALTHVMNDDIQLIPPKFKNTYSHWMENVRDWCISRQLWWGHRIPAWYDETGAYVVAKTEEEAINQFKLQNASFKSESLKQDPDVMDTWFSSWLWPIAVFDTSVFKDPSNKGNKDLNYYYPTNDLVTAPEILFFWVARMIIAGYEYRGNMPFKNVYLTGIVRDKLGRKMSKSLGNSPDPLNLIGTFGADAVRVGMLFSSPAGNDLLYDEKLIEQGRNFANKIWNAFRLVKGWTITNDNLGKNENALPIRWFQSKLDSALIMLDDDFSKFRMSGALMTIYKLIWDDFCSWYLEMIKPEFGKPIDEATYSKTVEFFETLLKALHPFMPFITEELYHELKERNENCIIVADWPRANTPDQKILDEGVFAFEVITEIRNIRNSKGISPKEALKLVVKEGQEVLIKDFWPVIKKLSNISDVSFSKEKISNASTFVIKSTEFFIPVEGKIDAEKERESIHKELDYYRGFMVAVDKKLSNEKFVKSAPPNVIDLERKKKADAEIKIQALEERLKHLP